MADTNNTTMPRQAGQTLGLSGTIIQGGIIVGEDYSRDLHGPQGMKMYEIMRKSDTAIRRTLLICKLPILSSQKVIQPASDDPEDVFRADFIRRELFTRNVKYNRLEREALTFFDFGHSVFEKTYELTEYEGRTLIGIKSIDSRKQTSIWRWETEDHQPGITQLVMADKISIPRAKLLVFTHEQEGENFAGISLLRSAYKDWNIKDKLTIMNAMALEKLASGVPTAKLDGTKTVGSAEMEKVRNALRQLRANEEAFIEIPEGVIVEMLDMKAGTTKDVLPTIHYHNREIVGSVLAQFTELGSQKGSGGANALSQDQSALFMKSEEAADQILVDAMQEDLIKQLCDLNWSDNDARGYPQLIGGQISDDDVATMSDAIQKLMTAGALTADVEIEQTVRKTLHLPEMSEDDQKAYKERKQLEADNAAAAQTVDPGTGKPVKKTDPTLKASAVVEASRDFRRRINVLFQD